MIKKTTFFLFFNLGILSLAMAQEIKITPSSPESSSVAKYINFPVDYSTGVPDITIPLFDINSGELSLPVSLSYHAGGIKVNEKSTWVGLGWSLSAEPEITRTINSMPDEKSGYITATYPYYNSGDYENTIDFGRNIILQGIDRDPDEFYYHLSHSSGKFYFANSIPGVGYKAIPVPYSPINIQVFQGSIFQKITDVDGTLYIFGSSTGTNAEEQSDDAQAVTTWKCSQMISPSKADTIFFTYSPQVHNDDVDFNERMEVYDNFQKGNLSYLNNLYFSFGINPQNNSWNYTSSTPYGAGTPRILNYSPGSDNGLYVVQTGSQNQIPQKDPNINSVGSVVSMPQTETIKISTIKYRTGSVKFFQHYHPGGYTNELDSIAVSDYNGNLIKTVQFFWHNCYNTPNVGTADYMTLLDSLYIKDNTGKKIERYAFDYNSGYSMQYGAPRADPWGYYNGSSTFYMNDINAVPLQIVPTVNYYYTYPNNNPNSTTYTLNVDTINLTIGSPSNGVSGANQAFILRKIHYPTGGRSEFTYETNQSSTGNAGGLRIENIKYYTDEGSYISMEKHYKYGYGENGIGFLKAPDYLSNYSYAQTVYYLNPTLGASLGQGDAPSFEQSGTYVTEQKRTFLTHSMKTMAFSNGSPVVYNMVTEYQIDNGVQTGKTIYQYNYNSTVTDSQPLIGNISQQFDEWPWGQLLSTTYYAYLNNRYVWLKKSQTNYIPYERPELIHVLKAFDPNTFSLNNGATITDEYQYDGFMQMFDYTLTSGVELPSLETDSLRDLSDTTQVVATAKNYYYDNPNSIFATRESYSDGTGNIRTEYTTHPNDYPANDPVIGPLLSANMLDHEVEKVVTLKAGSAAAVVLSGSLNTYASNGLKLSEQKIEPTAPLALSNFKFSGAPTGQLPTSATIGASNFTADSKYVVKQTYDLYDSRGNIDQTTDKGQVITSYLWDYNSSVPVAEVKNTTNGQFAYTSFESSNQGNWSYSTQIVQATDGRTGTKDATISTSNTISKSGLNSSQTYQVSYWSKSASPYSIAGTIGTVTSAKTVLSTNGIDHWYYYIHQVTGQSTITISGTGTIDEVRLIPSNAQMTTYTYNPTVGLTSSTDEKGETTFYSYDAYGRLILIQDQSGNIMKRFKYHYNYE